jgi:hypothetical protein
MNHTVAIVKTHGQYISSTDDYSRIAQYISEWAKVTSEELEILKNQQWSKDFLLIEKIPNQIEFIGSTVQAVLEEIRLEQARAEAAREVRRAKRAADAAKRAEKEEEKKVALLKKLQSEVGHLVT